MSVKNEKKRTPNFSSSEVDILLVLVKTHRDIIECKQSDKVLWKQKNSTWLHITEIFNASSGACYRDVDVLRKKYENIKKIKKKKYADEKCALYGTGGGSSVPSSITNVDEKVKELIEIQVIGMESVYDNDAVQVDCMEEQTSRDSTTDWSKYVPAMLRQPISKELIVQDDDTLAECEEDPNPTPSTSSATKKSETFNSSRNPPIRNKKGKVTPQKTEKWECLAKAKIELVQFQKKAPTGKT